MIHLTEAVARRMSGKYANRFPYSPETDLIVDFLVSKGFTQILPNEPDRSMSPRELKVECQNGEKLFTVGLCNPGEPGTFWVAICGGKDGIVWICRTDEGINPQTARLPGGLFRAALPERINGSDFIEYLTYESFREEICKHFNWK